MKKLSIIFALVMLAGLFSSCDVFGDGDLVTNSYTPDFEVSYEPLPKRVYCRGERLTITTCVENISGKDLTYTAPIDTYYPSIELCCRDSGDEVAVKIMHEPLVTVSGIDEFTAAAGQIGKMTYTFIIPEDAASGAYSVTLNYRGDVCTYNDVFVISDRLPHIYGTTLISSGSYAINPISVSIGDTFYKNEESVFTEEIAGWSYIMNNSMYKVDEFPTLVLDGEIELQMRENVSISRLQIYGTDFNYDSHKLTLDSFAELGSLEKGEYVVVAFENEKIAADAPHYVVGEYDYKLTKSALVFKLIVQDSAVPRKQLFEFSYEIEKTEYLRGENITINAIVMNISGQALKTYLFFPSIELYWLNDKGEIGGKLEHQIMPKFEAVEQTIENGGTGSYTYVFPIPESAHCGEYSIRLWYRDESRVFENVLRITDVTSQNENAEYRYSPISVSAGGESVNPIRVGTSTQIQQADGTCMIGCDGLGVWRYFGEEDTDLSTFPLLVLEDEPKLTLPENTRLEGVRVYDLNANEIGGYYASLKALEAFPAGEYVVVIKAVYDTSALSKTEYETTYYDDFFRLSIPQNTKINEFDYSPVKIGCGGVEIIPIRTFLYSSYQNGDEGIEADGIGAAELFYDKSFSPEDLPELTLKSNVVSYCPAGVTIGKAKVFDLEYNQLHLEMEYMWDFSKLPAGEYIIVFSEKEVDENTTYGYESLFKLVIPE